ncbi:hypothetical protein Pst134EB_014001 [Puccinia striiformis f. sp. tritici]|nr:hypothetical protein Pst134EB_014001 [Puccinia striiformis f. sp. tritici]
MSSLPFSLGMEGGFESTTPSRHGPYASTDTSDQDQMDDDTPKQHNTPRKVEDPFDNLGNQSPKRPTRGPPREPPQGPPAGYGLHNIVSLVACSALGAAAGV